MNPKVEYVFAEKFDWLIICDAMRYDYFKKYCKLKGELKAIISPANCTEDFLDAQPKTNALLVTGQPLVLKHKDKFRAVIDAGFDNYFGTTLPCQITRWIPKVKHKKPVVLWFTQPHQPFVVYAYKHPEDAYKLPFPENSKEYEKSAKLGVLEKAYEMNVKWILEHIEKYVIPELDGKIIISSDHGLGLGKPLRKEDKPVYAHWGTPFSWEVRLVPKLTILK